MLFVSSGAYDDDEAPMGTAVFPLHSLLSHSCEPNCSYLSAMMPDSPPFITCLPCRDIDAGEELTISYMEAARLEACGGVVGRRALLCAVRRYGC